MRVRKRVLIEHDIKASEQLLVNMIEDSVSLEELTTRRIAEQEERLKKLREELPFEETLEGKIREAEKVAFCEIGKITKELSRVTGKDYALDSGLKG